MSLKGSERIRFSVFLCQSFSPDGEIPEKSGTLCSFCLARLYGVMRQEIFSGKIVGQADFPSERRRAMRWMQPFGAALAMGFLFAWMESLFLDYGLLRRLATQGYEGDGAMLFLGFHAFAYLGAGLLSLGGFPKKGFRGLPFLGVLCMLSLPLSMWSPVAESSLAVPLAGVILAAVGSALLFGQWGTFLSTFAPGDVALVFGLSPFAALFLMRFGAALDPRLLILGAPLFGGALFLVMHGELGEEEEQLTPLPNFPLWRLSLFLFCFYAAQGFLLSLMPVLFTPSVPRTGQAAAWIHPCAALAGALAFRHWPRVNLGNFYRGAFPFIAGALFLLFFSPFTNISRLFLEGGLTLLDLYAWLLLIYHASRRGHRRGAVVNWGLFLMIAAGMGGHIHLLFGEKSPLLSGEPYLVSVVLMGILLLLMVLALWDVREVPLRWSGKELPVAEPEDREPAKETPPDKEEEMRRRLKLMEFGLTRQETEIALLLLKGLKDMNICSLLYISQNTLKYHLRNIYRKTGSGNRRELKSSFE